jgi:hypothetical protein
MNKLTICFLSIITSAICAEQQSHASNLNHLIKQLRLKTHRSEFIEAPQLLQSIISELYMIQSEFQSLSIFTHQILQNLSDATVSFNAISEQLSNIIPERQIALTLEPKNKAAKKKTSLSHALKTLEKYHVSLGKNIRDITTVNKILHATLEELEAIQIEISSLANTVKTLAISYHHQSKDLFAVALKLFKLAGIESDTGPYLCQADNLYETMD